MTTAVFNPNDPGFNMAEALHMARSGIVVVLQTDLPTTPVSPSREVEALAWSVRDKTGEIWVCDFGVATLNKSDAESFIVWATKNRPVSAPFTLCPLAPVQEKAP